jgi:TPR repeat protein
MGMPKSIGCFVNRLAVGCLLLVWAGCHQAPPAPLPPQAPAVDPVATKAKAEAGDAAAQNAMGDLYAHGTGVKQDYKEAARWYRLAADQGLPVAEANLAGLYAAGATGKTDTEEAVKWYRRAADHGSTDAQYTLAQLLSRGLGVKRDIREALRLYNEAAAHGDGLSQYNLARRYREGKDVPKDAVQAYFWFTLAAANGIPDAEPMRAELKKEMTQEQVAEAERKVSEFKAAGQKAAAK